MSNLVLIVRLAGQRVAIRADLVASVVELDEISPVPRAPPHIAGLAALRSRVLTVVDAYRALGIPGPAEPGREAIVVEIEGHHYAITVDGVDDVVDADVEAIATGPLMRGGWGRIAAGSVEADGDMLLLVEVAALVAGAEALAA